MKIETLTTLDVAVPTLPKLYRILHDTEREDYNYQSRTAAPDWFGVGPQTPEVIPCMYEANSRSGTFRTNVAGWERYFRELNPSDGIASSDKKFDYLTASWTALFNQKGWDKYESIVMGGNVVQLDEITTGVDGYLWGKIRSMDVNDPIPSARDVNFETAPWLIHWFVVVGWKESEKRTYWANTPRGIIFYPLVTMRPMWIRMDYVKEVADVTPPLSE